MLSEKSNSAHDSAIYEINQMINQEILESQRAFSKLKGNSESI